jgi:hypothetical protein
MENNYLVFLRDEEYLAIQNNDGDQYNPYDVNENVLIPNLRRQGYFLIGRFFEVNITEAIEAAKEYLKFELNKLVVENEKLKKENNQLKYRGYDKTTIDKFILSEIDPYEILGVNKEDDISVIKIRVNKIRGVFHPDKSSGDSSFIFRMINSAFEKIEKN